MASDQRASGIFWHGFWPSTPKTREVTGDDGRCPERQVPVSVAKARNAVGPY